MTRETMVATKLKQLSISSFGVPLVSLRRGVLNFSAILASGAKTVQMLEFTNRSLKQQQLPTKLDNISSTTTFGMQNKVNRRITTITSSSTYMNITNNDKIKCSSENNQTSGYSQHTANATISNLETAGGNKVDRGNHTTLPFHKIASLKSEAMWIINGSLLLFLCLAGLLLFMYLRKKKSTEESINPKNKSIKVLAIAGGIVTAVSSTTAQEKVEMVCRTFDTRHDQPDFERFTIPRN